MDVSPLFGTNLPTRLGALPTLWACCHILLVALPNFLAPCYVDCVFERCPVPISVPTNLNCRYCRVLPMAQGSFLCAACVASHDRLAHLARTARCSDPGCPEQVMDGTTRCEPHAKLHAQRVQGLTRQVHERAGATRPQVPFYEGVRCCRSCGLTKPTSSFGVRYSEGVAYLRASCKVCRRPPKKGAST